MAEEMESVPQTRSNRVPNWVNITGKLKFPPVINFYEKCILASIVSLVISASSRFQSSEVPVEKVGHTCLGHRLG